jgi:hypothetical protein
MGESLVLKGCINIFITGGNSFFMNTNEECLLLFLKNPGRIDKTTSELKNFIFSRNDNIINREFAATKVSNPIKERFERLFAGDGD